MQGQGSPLNVPPELPFCARLTRSGPQRLRGSAAGSPRPGRRHPGANTTDPAATGA